MGKIALMTRSSHLRRISLAGCVTVVVLAMIVIGTGLAQTSTGRHVLGRAGLAQPAEPYTELYFPHPATVVSASASGIRKSRVAFVVHNVRHARTRYAWRIVIRPRGRTYSGAVSVPVGQRSTVVRRIQINCRSHGRGHRGADVHARRHVRVSLPGVAESIGYWVSCRA